MINQWHMRPYLIWHEPCCYILGNITENVLRIIFYILCHSIAMHFVLYFNYIYCILRIKLLHFTCYAVYFTWYAILLYVLCYLFYILHYCILRVMRLTYVLCYCSIRVTQLHLTYYVIALYVFRYCLYHDGKKSYFF